MRNIKFRAWDDKNKKWLMGYEHPSLGGFSMFGECMMFGEWEQVLNSRPLQELDTIKLMQYTGLQDKNGKEIYEGDIVYFEEPEFESEMLTCPVVFYNGAFCAKWRNGWITLAEANGEFDKVEIIGNIYENSELIPPPITN